MADESEQVLKDMLGFAQRHTGIRRFLAGMLSISLLGLAGYFIYDLLPRYYVLTISGGDIVSNRHQVTRLLQKEAEANRVTLRIVPTHGSIEALERLDAGSLDMALVLGGIENTYSNVQHVATVGAELLHVLIRPGIAGIGDLHGRRINLGAVGAEHGIGREVLRHSGLEAGIDYIETDHSSEELIAMRPDRLPDVVFDISLPPSYLADFLVRERGYELMAMPFPDALALRLGWVTGGSVLPYTYSINPPVPPSDMSTIGVGLHLMANRSVDPRAVFQVLEALLSPTFNGIAHLKVSEDQLTHTSGYPVSPGTVAYLNRNDPLISAKNLDKIKSAFGLAMSILTTVLVVGKWFKGPPAEAPKLETKDEQFRVYIRDVGEIEDHLFARERQGALTRADLDPLIGRLSNIRAEGLLAYSSAQFRDPSVVEHFLLSVDQARTHLMRLYDRLPVATELANDPMESKAGG